MAIDSLRKDLMTLTRSIVDDLEERKKIVKEIQDFKNTNTLLIYDFQREKEVFTALKEQLRQCSLKDLLILSLIIESHAGESYPQWSESIHLNSHRNKIIEKINPLLLLLLEPTEFKMLDLKSEFKDLNE